MEQRTHQTVDPKLCGRPVVLENGRSVLSMTVRSEMAADETGLAHGGFVFGLADYAAMLAVNHPNVVLGSAQARFLRPVMVTDELVAEASLTRGGARKYYVDVVVRRGDVEVFAGEFVCFTPEQHVAAVAEGGRTGGNVLS